MLGGTPSYKWSFSSDNPTGSKVVKSFTSAGMYTAKLIVDLGGQCIDSATRSLIRIITKSANSLNLGQNIKHHKQGHVQC